MAAYIGRGVVCMPPMFVNVGAYVGEGTMIDSHALVGSCAQIGRNCHISAGSQIGGVLEPVGAMPVIIEDEVLVGGNCGVYEGTVVKHRAVLGTGTILESLDSCLRSRARRCIHRERNFGRRILAARDSRGSHRRSWLARRLASRRRQTRPQPAMRRHREIPRRKNRFAHPA